MTNRPTTSLTFTDLDLITLSSALRTEGSRLQDILDRNKGDTDQEVLVSASARRCLDATDELHNAIEANLGAM